MPMEREVDWRHATADDHHDWLTTMVVADTNHHKWQPLLRVWQVVSGHKHLNKIRHQNPSQLGALDHGRSQEIEKKSENKNFNEFYLAWWNGWKDLSTSLKEKHTQKKYYSPYKTIIIWSYISVDAVYSVLKYVSNDKIRLYGEIYQLILAQTT